MGRRGRQSSDEARVCVWQGLGWGVCVRVCKEHGALHLLLSTAGALPLSQGAWLDPDSGNTRSGRLFCPQVSDGESHEVDGQCLRQVGQCQDLEKTVTMEMESRHLKRSQFRSTRANGMFFLPKEGSGTTSPPRNHTGSPTEDGSPGLHRGL